MCIVLHEYEASSEARCTSEITRLLVSIIIKCSPMGAKGILNISVTPPPMQPP